MTTKTSLTVRIRIFGLRETLAKFKQLPDDATRELRQASLAIAGALAVEIRHAAKADSAQSGLLAPTVKPLFDRVPSVKAGGASRKVGRNRVPAYKVLFGAEFGSHSLAQFDPFNPDGYWFFETVQSNEDYISREWDEAADEIIRKWAS